MPIKIEDKMIGARKFTTHQLPPTKAAPLMFKAINALGGSVKEISAIFSKKSRTDEDEIEALMKAINVLFVKVTPEELTAIIKSAIVEHTYCDGTKITDAIFDSVFAENIMEMFQVFAFVMQVNFSDFIQGLGQIGLLKTPTKE